MTAAWLLRDVVPLRMIRTDGLRRYGGLLLRVAGDLAGRGPVWQGGSVLTVLALLAFVATAAVSVVRG